MSNLTALIARDEYVLEESYSGEEEADDDAEEVKSRFVYRKRIMKMWTLNYSQTLHTF